MPASISRAGNEIWTIDIKLTWQAGPFGINIEHRNGKKYGRVNFLSSKIRSKFPDYLDGLEIGDFGLHYHADFDGWVEVCCVIGWFGVGGDEEEEVEDEDAVIQEDESLNMVALGKEIMAFVTKRMEEAREE
ncbi:hypothetical protein BPAE_0015g00430 [Botrytis paeoniae]|uniref:Uncharacterized protein n=1 Tax=Botrytis paeoniae TaxID=278948 RepID=A0A4Z1G2V8_9HELO|nr:hypothetical protein BPAE_0015g00430 [Botrytis paeoniae]